MKKAILVLAISTFAFSCSKKKDDPTPVTQPPTPVVTPPTPSTLELSLVDKLGNPVINSNVRIFKTRAEWMQAVNELKAFDKFYINTTSTYKFDITQDGYYILAVSKDCLNNVIGGNLLTELEPNVAHKQVVVLTKNSTMQIVNERSVSVAISKDSSPYLTVKAFADTTVFLPENTYTFSVTGGSVDKTIACGTKPKLSIF